MLFTVVTTFFAAFAAAAVLPKREINKSPYAGNIVTPATNGSIIPGNEFPFSYEPSDWCESAFQPFSVYLTQGAEPPTFDAVTENGTLADGTYVFNFGTFVVSHFGLPLPTGSVAPPDALMFPPEKLDAVNPVYINVVQTFQSCPGHIAVEYSLSSVPISVRGTA